MKIEDIEGIGPTYGEKLRGAGVKTVEQLLQQGASQKGREELSNQTGIDRKKILRWVNLCDLCRITGVSTQYSELLEASGVDTIKELRTRNSENLHSKMTDVNSNQKLVKTIPSGKLVSQWIAQAKDLDPIVRY